jgi:predicted RNase H-like HicB family nuclease
MIMEYTILVYKAEESGFRAEVPALPGCVSQGETVEETIVNTKEAIELHISCLKDPEQEWEGAVVNLRDEGH